MRPLKRHIIDENAAQAGKGAKRLLDKPVGKCVELKERVLKQQQKLPNEVHVLHRGDKISCCCDPLISMDMAEDIKKYALHLEDFAYFISKLTPASVIEWRVKQILFNWLFYVKKQFTLLSETLMLTFRLIKLTIKSVSDIDKDNMQLVGVTCIFIAAKYEENIPPLITDLVAVSAGKLTTDCILKMERVILKHISFSNFGLPCAFNYLRQFRYYLSTNDEVYQFAKCLCDVSNLVHELENEKPSVIAASSLYLSSVAHNKMSLALGKVFETILNVDLRKILMVAKILVTPTIQYVKPGSRFPSIQEIYMSVFEFSSTLKERMQQFANTS